MDIPVTQAHIDHSTSSKGKCCPINTAIRALGYINPMSGEGVITFTDPDLARFHAYTTPQEAIVFMRRYDDFLDVEPFVLHLTQERDFPCK